MSWDAVSFMIGDRQCAECVILPERMSAQSLRFGTSHTAHNTSRLAGSKPQRRYISRAFSSGVPHVLLTSAVMAQSPCAFLHMTYTYTTKNTRQTVRTSASMWDCVMA